jgi:iron complex transport system substrate-binding protein
MKSKALISIFQASIIVLCGIGIYNFVIQEKTDSGSGDIKIIDSNEVEHYFEEPPERVALTNTYAATVMRMLGISEDRIVGVSGDFSDEKLWPELSDKPMIQYSAHSEIDFEAILDTRPDVYIVFANNGMVDTKGIREKLQPVGIRVVALDFYKYDTLRYEINVLATLFDKEDQMNILFEEFDEIEAMVASKLTDLEYSDRPKIVMEHHASLTRDPVVLTGTSQWTDMIDRAGGINVFEKEPGHTTHVDMEAILDHNPDVLMFDGITFDIGFNRYDEDGTTCENHMEHIESRAGFENINAVMNERMLILSGEFAGPMMIHGLPTLAKYLHPNMFSDIDAESYLDDYFTTYHGVERVGKFVCAS